MTFIYEQISITNPCGDETGECFICYTTVSSSEHTGTFTSFGIINTAFLLNEHCTPAEWQVHFYGPRESSRGSAFAPV